VAYKWLNSKRKEKNQYIALEDIKDDDLPLALCWSKKMGRNTNDVEVFDVSKGYKEFAVDFLNGKKTQFRSDPIPYDSVNPEYKDQLKNLSLQDNVEKLDEEMQLALAMSLSLSENSQ